MSIIFDLTVEMAKKKLRSKELADAIGMTEQNLSIIKTGKAKAIRLTTLDALCEALHCQPSDIIRYVPNKVIEN